MLLCNIQNSFDLLKFKIYYYTFLIILHYSIISCGAQISFNYTTFGPNTEGIVYDGNATASNPVIQLTLNQNDMPLNKSSGRATYFEPMHLWDKESGSVADFSTHFVFKIDSRGLAKHSDGMAFFLAPEGFPMPSTQQGQGLGLVLFNDNFKSSMTQFVAVEFDTYVNNKDTWDSKDPPYVHVGIDINSMVSVDTVSWRNNISGGLMNEAWISYNSSAKNLTVLFRTLFESETSLQSLWYEIDLCKYLPEKVMFGFSAATGRLYFEIHTIHSWSFSSNIHINTVDSKPSEMSPKIPLPVGPKRKNSGKVVVGLVVGASACILIIGVAFLWFKSRKKQITVSYKEKDDSMVPYEFENETGPKKYSYEILSASTNNFAEEEKIGQGGFGGVYKGYLSQIKSAIAVKRISKGSKQGIKEYASEVKIISRVRHRNLVQLIGWCHEEKELLLVYEFMPNGSLDSHLFKDNMFLTWIMRYNIARGLASALLYLHEEWEQCVLHRDIKSSNVMLDSDFNAKLGDFGLARLVDHGKEIETTLLAGTMGYMAPEYVMTGRASKETDVYSFGIVALEIASGRKPINPRGKQGEVLLVEFVWELYGQGKILEAADPKLSADFNDKELTCLLIVGLWCAHPDHKLRPSIRQAIQVLNFEAPLPGLASTMPTLNYSTTTSLCSDSHTGSTSVVSN